MTRRQPSSSGGRKSAGSLRLEALERRVLFSADLPLVSDLLGDISSGSPPIVGSMLIGADSAAESHQAEPVELVVIDRSSEDGEAIAESLASRNDNRFHVYLLDPGSDGLSQLSEIMARHSNVTALHLLTSGSDATVSLGKGSISLADVLACANEVAGWREGFADKSELTIYGTGLTDAAEADNFVTTLSELTGTEVTALADFRPAWLDASADAIVSPSSLPTDAGKGLELVFIDTATPNYELLLTDLLTERDGDRYLQVIMLDPDRDGVEQITAGLAGYHGVEAVHIISHGADGGVELGSGRLSETTIDGYRQVLEEWGQHLGAEADILIYGCNLAAYQDGQRLIDTVAGLTGADVAASDDLTGHESLGGDWDLEYQRGAIETSVAISAAAQEAWMGTLATITSDGGGATANISVTENTTAVTTVTATGNPGDTLTFSIDPASADAAVFAMDGTTGELRFAVPPDFEAPVDTNADNVYEVTVQADDGNGGVAAQDLFVAVVDVTESVIISLPGSGITYTENDPATALDPNATITDLENAAIDGAVLTVTIESGGTANDELSVLKPADREFRVTGNTIRMPTGNTILATLSGGNGGSPLVLTWTSNATLADVQNVLRHVAYGNVSETPTPDTRTLDITFVDGNGVSGNTAHTSVTMVPVNDAPSAILLSSSVVSENTDSSAGYSIGTLTTVDADSVGPFAYTIVGGVDATVFSIGGIGNDELVITDGTLDYEGQSSYSVVVRTTDDTGLSFDQTLLITVADVNEHAISTISDSDSAADTAAEDATPGTSVGITAFAEDADSTDIVSYSLDDDAAGRFTIDAATGEVTVAGPLDHEASTSHSITVRATSSDGSFTTRAFTVDIGDINDNAPVITPAQSFNVSENAATGTVVGVVAATDADATGALQGWTISAGNPDGIFAIDASSGEISIADATQLDHETTGQYTLTLEVGDGVNTAVSETVLIQVSDVNEAPSQLTLSSATLTENTGTLGGFAVGVLSAMDEDLDEVFTYEVVGGLDADLFSVRGINGDTLTIDDGILDYERQPSYEVRIRATDAGGLQVERDFVISVNDLNDAPSPAADALTATEDRVLTIDTNADLLANDSDQDADTLNILSFTQPVHGVLMDNLDGTLSYQPNANYNGPDSFRYQVSDGNGGTSWGVADIYVQPVNDAPTLAGPTDLAANENSSGNLAAFLASDADGNWVTLSLAGPDRNAFTLDAATGELRFATSPDFEQPADADGDNLYELRITASDPAGGSVTVPVNVAVTDVNEAPRILVSEIQAIQGFGEPLGTLSYNDPDAGDEVQITVTGGSGSAFFAVDAASGAVTRTGDPAPGTYVLNVSLTDSHGLETTGTLTIQLLPGDLPADSDVPSIDGPDPDPAPGFPNQPAVSSGSVSIGPAAGTDGKTTAADEAGESGRPHGAPLAQGFSVRGAFAATDLDSGGGATTPGEAPQRLPGQSGPRTDGGHATVLELLLEQTDELVEIAIGQIVDTGLDTNRISVALSPGMLNALDEMRQELNNVDHETEEKVDLLIQTGAVATLSLTAGFVSWLLRTGSLLATLLSTSPIWRPFDPIPVLASPQETDADNDEKGRDRA